jgi:CelD/BcsL family acetyltransferase involved in cellulose biosynthesis
LNLQIELFTSFSPALKEVWEKFEQHADCYFFQTHHWSKHWLDTVGNAEGYHTAVIVVYEEADIRMILPFAQKKKWGVSGIEWMGGIQTDYKAPLIHPQFVLSEKDFAKVWKKISEILLANGISYCLFDNQPQLIGTAQNPFYHFFTACRIEYAHNTKLPKEAAEYFSTSGRKKILADSRRQRKRLAESGTLSFLIADSKPVFDELTQAMITQKQRRFLEMNVRNIIADQKIQNFYSSFQNTFIQCAGLKLNNTLIATHWGIVFRGRFYYLMPSFGGGEIGKYSAGRLLLEELINWAIDNGCHTFDFTIGGEAYKKDWCESEMSIGRSMIALSFKGKLMCNLLQLKQDAVDRIVKTKSIMAINRSIRKIIRG